MDILQRWGARFTHFYMKNIKNGWGQEIKNAKNEGRRNSGTTYKISPFR